MITQARLKQLLHYDPQLGWFMWLVDRGRNAKAGATAGWLDNGRLCVEVDGHVYWGARLAWFYVKGTWPTQLVDHWDTDPLNNCFQNLRDVSSRVNGQNKRRAKAGSSSGLLGVNRHNATRWRAQIFVNGKNKHLGLFDNKQDAHTAYVIAKRQHHEGCTL